MIVFRFCVVKEIKRLLLELNIQFSLANLESMKNWLWIRILMFEGSDEMTEKAIEIVNQNPHLRQAKDDKGRVVLELVPKDLKDRIISLFSWHGR